MSLYTNSKIKATVRAPNRDTGVLVTHSGLLQGDTPGPYLLAVCMDYVLRCVERDDDAPTELHRLCGTKSAVKLAALACTDIPCCSTQQNQNSYS